MNSYCRLPAKSIILGLGISLAIVQSGYADHLVLSNGGVVRGLLEEQETETSVEDPELFQIRTLSGNLVSFSSVDIEDTIYQPVVVEEYEVKVANTPQTVEDLWQLAEWCRKQELYPQWKTQLEEVLKLDSSHIGAQQMLTKADISARKQEREELMKSRGMVKYRGKFITEREKELIDELAEERERREVWWKKAKLWHGWLNHRSPTYQQKGIAAFRSINSVDALPALEKYLQQENGEDFRLLLVEVLPKIDDDRAVLKLIELSLLDSSLQVRKNAFNSLPPEKLEFVTAQYVRQLNHPENQVVRRSGDFLGEIGDIRVVPYLIDALITTHTYQVSVPIPRQTYSTGRTSPLLPPEIEYQLRTGQLPYGVIVDNSNNNSIQPPPQTKLVDVKRDKQNPEVLAALKTLTDQNFQYNEVQWRSWWDSVRDGKAPAPTNQNS
ncbi:hypothetical protein Pla110_39590 [Polystyrenella longa]|uniref:HEAT repeat domain-containing protein n=1 Tax=Polystyrenella longa TaxID=2528007 RepID=A0A518CSP9_9PLAN|nr:hypothetical protein [Polystyrenella longa]QDU82204.1 hypothetical protein Pla110_39590 [Polystyrenella longa]